VPDLQSFVCIFLVIRNRGKTSQDREQQDRKDVEAWHRAQRGQGERRSVDARRTPSTASCGRGSRLDRNDGRRPACQAWSSVRLC